MPISSFYKTEKAIELEEFVAYIDANIDLSDEDSVMSAAPMLEALACNKTILINEYNNDLKSLCDSKGGAAYSPSSIILASGRNRTFSVRSNLWPALADVPKLKSIEEGLFSYALAHNHNFSFLTANYFGPGYETELWEFDDLAQVAGLVGDHVNLSYLGRTRLCPGKQMFFRRDRDIHVQLAPESLSGSINLLIHDEMDSLTDQLFLDLSASKISGHSRQCEASLRESLMQFAGLFGDLNTADILVDLADQYPCQRTRAAALKGAIKILGNDFEPSSGVLGDQSPYVRNVLADAGLV